MAGQSTILRNANTMRTNIHALVRACARNDDDDDYDVDNDGDVYSNVQLILC